MMSLDEQDKRAQVKMIATILVVADGGWNEFFFLLIRTTEIFEIEDEKGPFQAAHVARPNQ